VGSLTLSVQLCRFLLIVSAHLFGAETTLEKSQEAAVKPPPIPSPNFSSQPKSNISSITPALPKDIAPPSSMSASSKANPPTSLPAIRYAAAAAAAVSSPLVSPTVLSNTSAPSEFNAPPSLPSPTTEGTQSLSAPSPPPSHLSTVSSPSSSNAVPGGMSFEQQKAQAQEQARASAAAQQAAQQDESEHSLSNPAYSSGGYPSRPPSQPQQLQPQQLQQQQQPQQPSLSPLSTRQSPSLNNLSPQPQSLAPAGAPSALQQQQGQYPRPGSSSNAGASSSRAPLPNALADLVTSFETAKTRCTLRPCVIFARSFAFFLMLTRDLMCIFITYSGTKERQHGRDALCSRRELPDPSSSGRCREVSPSHLFSFLCLSSSIQES
jgi:CCR4-NOT transcription complex subunit 3